MKNLGAELRGIFDPNIILKVLAYPEVELRGKRERDSNNVNEELTTLFEHTLAMQLQIVSSEWDSVHDPKKPVFHSNLMNLDSTFMKFTLTEQTNKT